MSTMYRYTLPVEQTHWTVDGQTQTSFTWEYDQQREKLLKLYDKGKSMQWDAQSRIDWSTDLDPENPMEIDDRIIPIFGSSVWDKMPESKRTQLRHHQQAAQISQFLHGEQGALVACAKIVQTAPDLDAKFYASTQVMDEARHVEAYSRLLHEKFELAYPINPHLKALLEDALSDSRWDMTYLAMQVLIEGLALAAFQRIRDYASNKLAASINAYVMQDEARHVSFGRLALRDYYPQLTDAERDEREEFVVEACYHMRDRFNQMEVWERLDLPIAECMEAVAQSENTKLFRTQLFSRIVPTVKDIGLWGPRVRKAYTDMGVMEYADVDAEQLLEDDHQAAQEFDAKQFVEQSVGAA
ncbi:MAG: ferritin-like domain-containing protein [Gammaproteobacteria bacterium]|nr:ferritin-like domain-containing protein [Gammaproteobacteria bacterium]